MLASMLVTLPLTTALAQNANTTNAPEEGTMPGNGPGMMRGGGAGAMGPGQFLVDPSTLPALKEKLNITDKQDSAWQSYADIMTNTWEMRESMRQSMQEQKMTMKERMAARAEHQEAGMSIHAEIQKIRDELSAILSPQQREIFDQQAPSMPANMLPPQ